LHDSGIDLPTVTSAANLNPLFFKQYGQFAPKDLYFNAVPYYGGKIVTNPPTRAALATLTRELAKAGAKPDQIEISAWDPAMIVVDALRKLGPDATAAELRTYLLSLHGYAGVNGPYDFSRFAQRGLGENSALIVRWDTPRGEAVAVSRFGGEPL
jgi:branched-chain amino acid transport system substrate-binding protein